MKKPNCYKCKWGRNLPGDTHFYCTHPKVSDEVIFFLTDLLNCRPATGRLRPLNIRGNSHGIKNGWFTWPVNFDPIWLLNCDGFEEINRN